MANYNYYDKLQKKFNNEKKYNMGVFDKPTYNGYNENAEWDKSLYDYRPNYGHSERNVGQGIAFPFEGKVLSEAKRMRWNDVAPAVYGSSQNTQYKPPYEFKPTYDSAFKKNAENQWYNKITHGSFKEDDWFKSMVKNQAKAQSWYNNTYGEKNGKKEYQNLHNRLINTPYNKIKEEEKQFINYKASDFKVPEMKPVNYSYSGGSKGELNREKTGCYKKGDENLPFLTRYIINGNDGKTGGLNKTWQNASSDEERARIEKVAEMLRAEETDYDIRKSNEVLILYDADGAMKQGHTAVIIMNSDGQGVYFSFAEDSGWLWGDGEISFDILNKEQMDLFLKNGEMRYIGTSSGTVGNQHYTDYVKIPITSEQGASMIGKGIGYFNNPGKYNIAKLGNANQCDSVVSNILNSGGLNYDSKLRPKTSFYDYSEENGYEIFSIME
jgi:hypothetical protein